jgi:hypothetical protein
MESERKQKIREAPEENSRGGLNQGPVPDFVNWE